MWSMEVTVAVPTARDTDHLAEIAGSLVEALEAAAGETGPVVAARYVSDNPVVIVAIDIDREDPTTAVSDALTILNRVAQRAEIPLGDVRAISLNITDDAEITPELASA